MVEANRLVQEMMVSSWGMTALAVCLETGILKQLQEPATVPDLAAAAGVEEGLATNLLEVMAALGLVDRQGDSFVADPGVAPFVAGPGALALLTSSILQQAEFLREARSGTPGIGWRHSDPHVLEAQGTWSAGIVRIFKEHAFGHMDGLNGVLEQPGAAFLDVGAGVGAISIAMCRSYPQLRAVGLEPAEVPRRAGIDNVERSGLAGRIEIRAQLVEELDDEAAFHLAQIPIQFLPTDVVKQGLEAVHRALVPGGWVILQVVAMPGPELAPAVVRLWARIWGSEAVVPDQALQLVEEAGFVDTALLPVFPGPPTRYVVGRRG